MVAGNVEEGGLNRLICGSNTFAHQSTQTTNLS